VTRTVDVGYIGAYDSSFLYLIGSLTGQIINTPGIPNTPDIPCFDEDTMILCPDGNKKVKFLKVGDEVVTYKHGNLKIKHIGQTTQLFNYNDDYKISMYRMKKDDTMNDDLIVTGRHAILLDDWSSHIHKGGRKKVPKTMVDNKQPLISSLCNKFKRETEVKQYTVYHIALDGEQTRYGVFANGVLMESWDKRQESM
jgi:hypothetical protein